MIALVSRHKYVIAGVIAALIALVIATTAFGSSTNAYGIGVDAYYYKKGDNIQVITTLTAPYGGQPLFKAVQLENGDVVLDGMPGRPWTALNIGSDESRVMTFKSAIKPDRYRGQTIRVVLVQVSAASAPAVAQLPGGTILVINDQTAVIADSDEVEVPVVA